MPAPSTVTISGNARGETREIPGPSPGLGPLPRLPTLPVQEALNADNDEEIEHLMLTSTGALFGSRT